MPIGVPRARLLERELVAVGEDDDLVAGLGVRRSAERREEVVGVGAVGDRRRLLLERGPAVVAGGDGRDRLAEVAAGADLGGHRCHQPLVPGDVAEVRLEPWRALGMAGDRRDLDLVHREDHRARAAPAAELEAGRRDRLERDATAAVLRSG